MKILVWVMVLWVLSPSAMRKECVEDELWGFYAHKMINQYAVFLLPIEMLELYKPNISFLSEHAVDPDKRRYAQQAEAPKHYIDSEQYLTSYDRLPANILQAFERYVTLVDGESGEGYSSQVAGDSLVFDLEDGQKNFALARWEVDRLYFEHILPYRMERRLELDLCTVLGVGSELVGQVEVLDSLSSKGVAPYHLSYLTRKLVYAFEQRDAQRILRYSADIGHYVSDLHVPLHNTENYNGQLTDQVGIHAFWESRIPEEFAESEYDFFMQKASFISHWDSLYMAICDSSRSMVPKVLWAEREARASMSKDEIWCYMDRNGSVVRQPCQKYTRAYDDRLEGMVERRMRESIEVVASVWYSCWVRGGRPALGEVSMVLDAQDSSARPHLYLDGQRQHGY